MGLEVYLNWQEDDKHENAIFCGSLKANNFNSYLTNFTASHLATANIITGEIIWVVLPTTFLHIFFW